LGGRWPQKILPLPLSLDLIAENIGWSFHQWRSEFEGASVCVEDHQNKKRRRRRRGRERGRGRGRARRRREE
jgi:hypothetical protein